MVIAPPFDCYRVCDSTSQCLYDRQVLSAMCDSQQALSSALRLTLDTALRLTLAGILEASDGIMVARGDLGMVCFVHTQRLTWSHDMYILLCNEFVAADPYASMNMCL